MSQRTKICVGCQRLFEARSDAKTCSPRCRKRYQRARAHAYDHKLAALQRNNITSSKN